MHGDTVMGSQVQSKRPSKRRIVEEGQGRGKEVLEIDLNSVPDDVSEMFDAFYPQPDTATSAPSESVIPVEGPRAPAMSPICVDDLEDEVVIIAEHQVNQNQGEINWTGRAGMVNISTDIIHIDHENHPYSPVGEAGAILTSLSLGYHNVQGFIPASHMFNINYFEDLENDDHDRSKRMKAGSSRDPEVEIFQEDDETNQAGQPAFKCAVCLGAIVDETTTSCGHLFCQGCIKAAIKAQKKCPTCRKKLNMRNIHRIYFPGST